MALFRHFLGVSEDTTKSSVRIIDAYAEIRNCHLPNAKQKLYHFGEVAQLFCSTPFHSILFHVACPSSSYNMTQSEVSRNRTTHFSVHMCNTCTLRQVEEEMSKACSTNVERGMPIGYWWESQKERDHYEDQHIGVSTILKLMLRDRSGSG
jgi:hypothetical protein